MQTITATVMSNGGAPRSNYPGKKKYRLPQLSNQGGTAEADTDKMKRKTKKSNKTRGRQMTSCVEAGVSVCLGVLSGGGGGRRGVRGGGEETE